MSPQVIDLTNPEAVIGELFDEDRSVKDEFANHFGEEVVALSEALAECFRLLPALNQAANVAQSQRTALVAAFMFGVLDDLIISTKLLLTGKLPAAGNVMRQAVEGIAIAMLCSTDELLIIETKKKNQPPVTARYWEKLYNEDGRTQGHRAIAQLAWNANVVGVAQDAVERLRHAKNFYNGFSHCGTFSIASRMSLDPDKIGTVYVGGHFDPAKVDGYRYELNERLGLCRVIPPVMQHLTATM